MIILEENFKWHLEAFAFELFKCRFSGGNLCDIVRPQSEHQAM